jgi:tRNA-uridine 2-sulfurtransferase
MEKKQTIALLLSGGVDSCVAVHLLCQQGYKPDLFYIYIGADEQMEETSCASEDDLMVCQMMARRYGLKFEVVNLHKEYHTQVVGYMMDQARRGFTPNSDVMCNRLIKFGCFEDRVGHLYDKIATGHYARIVERDGRCWLATAADRLKDQTDFLCRINLPISHLMFPLGDLQKHQVRQIAEEARIPSANRPDSQGICFLGKVNFSDFLKQHLGQREGDIVERETGNVLGRHQGYWFFTIGQRKGIFLSGGPWFVVKKDLQRNIVYVSKGPNSALRFQRDIPLGDLLSLGADFGRLDGLRVSFKIRHVQEFAHGIFRLGANGTALIHSETDIHGVAPGQFCTIYDDEENLCLGSGEIICETDTLPQS